MFNRRSSSLHPCGGQCGKKGCTYIANRPANLRQHLSNKRYKCPCCTKDYSCISSMVMHARRHHPDTHPFGLSKIHLKIPARFMGTRLANAWQFLKHMVRHCIHSDRTHPRTRAEDLKRLSFMDNESIHMLTGKIADRILKDGLMEPYATDAFGGNLGPSGMILRHHGGLFKLSLDRLTNTHPNGDYFVHFPDPDKNPMANIRLVPLALNMSKMRAFTLQDIQQECNAPPPDVSALLEYEAKSTKSTLYKCVWACWNADTLARDAFPTVHEMWEWALARLRQIGGRCEISGIPLRTNQTLGSPFQMTIDAIRPRLQHVPGNMRITARFLNPPCHDKMKIRHDEGDGPSQWTPTLFRRYFRIS